MGKIVDMFKSKPTIEELEEENNRGELEYSIAKKKAMIKELEARGKRWEEFSNNGKKSGISFDKIAAWFKGSK